MKKVTEKKTKEVKPVTIQELKDYINEKQKAFSKQLHTKADAAGVKIDVRILVDIQTAQ